MRYLMKTTSLTPQEISEKLKQENLYLYVQNLGKTVPLKSKIKKTEKHPGDLYRGVFDGDAKLSTDNLLLIHKQMAIQKPPIDEKEYRNSKIMSLIRTSPRQEAFQKPEEQTEPTPSISLPSIDHYPSRRTDLNQLMFNEIFINPKLQALQKLEIQQNKERSL